MAGEIKLTGPSMQERIANRLRNSGEGSGADISVTKGSGPTRVHTNIHSHTTVRTHGGRDQMEKE
jgi:hypothetical protein